MNKNNSVFSKFEGKLTKEEQIEIFGTFFGKNVLFSFNGDTEEIIIGTKGNSNTGSFIKY